MEFLKQNIYGIACVEDPEDPDSAFLVTFKARDKSEALSLASCVCGRIRAEDALLEKKQ